MRNLVTAGIMALALGLLTLSALQAEEPIELPVIPDGSPLVYDQSAVCSATHGMYSHGYDTRGHAATGEKDYDVMVLGHLTPPATHGDTYVYLVFGGNKNMDVTEVYIALPGKPVERTTWNTLLARWPQQCSLIRELFPPNERGADDREARA